MPLYVKNEELLGVIGPEATRALCDRLGGQEIYLPDPSRLKPDSRIAAVLGMDAARVLASAWPKCSVCLPKNNGHLRARRDEEIRSSSLTIRELAQLHGLTERHIFYIRASKK